MDNFKKFNERAVLFGSNNIEDKGTFVDRFLEEQELKEYGIDLTIKDVIIDLESAKETLQNIISNSNQLNTSDSVYTKRVLEDLVMMLDTILNKAAETDNITADYLKECGNIKAKRLGLLKL